LASMFGASESMNDANDMQAPHACERRGTCQRDVKSASAIC
jgi:hypothetical protein